MWIQIKRIVRPRLAKGWRQESHRKWRAKKRIDEFPLKGDSLGNLLATKPDSSNCCRQHR
jgi:hypothetical protein